MAGRRSASRQARWARGPIPCSPGLRRPEASMFGEVSNLSLFYTPPFSFELDAYCTVRPSRVTCHVRTTRGRGCKGVRGGGSRRACGARASGVEDRDEPAAQSRPGWRIETSLRRKAVRTVARARGWARAARHGPTHLTPARERVASSADLSAPRLAPLGAETQAQHVNATASCRETATRSAPGPAQEDRRVRSGHARLPEPWRHEIEGWSAAGALAGGGGSSGVAGARGGVNVLRAPAGPGRAPPLCGALRKNRKPASKTVIRCLYDFDALDAQQSGQHGKPGCPLVSLQLWSR